MLCNLVVATGETGQLAALKANGSGPSPCPWAIWGAASRCLGGGTVAR